MTRSYHPFIRLITLSLIVACGVCHGKSEAAIELMVVDAATDTDLDPLRNGGNLDVSTLGSALTLRADPSVTGDESVVFVLDGARYQTENLAPYAMAGGRPYNAWDLKLGAHTLDVNVYDGRSGTGDLIASRNVSFSLIGGEIASQGDSPVVSQGNSAVAKQPSSPIGGQDIPCNLQQRIDQASPGAIIYGAGCVERSAVNPRKRLTLRNLTIKGSDDWSGDFTAVGGNYRSSRTVPVLDEPSTTDDSNNRQLCETANDVMCREAEMVFVNGTYLTQVRNGSDPGPGEFAMDGQRRVVLGSNPGSALVEVVVRQVGIHMQHGSAGTVLDNVHVTQVGNTVGLKGAGTGEAVRNNGRVLTMKNSEISWVHGSGLGCGGGGGVRCEITGTEVHHAGAAGVITSRSPLVFDHNRIHHNCSSLPDVRYNDTFVCSGIKIHGTSSGTRTVTNSEFYNNDHSGVWLDGGANNASIANNRIHHNDEQGIHIEISSDVTIRDNAIYENGWVGTPSTAFNSGAVYVHDSRNVKTFGNVMAWNRDGFAYIGGKRNGQNTGIEMYNNDIIEGATDPGKQVLTGWLLQGDNLGSNIAHDNRYYYGGQQDESRKRKFQWDKTQYTGLATFNSTPGEQNSYWLTGGEVNSILSANNIPRESH